MWMSKYSLSGWKKDVFEKKLVETFGEGTAYDYAKNGVDIDNQPIKAPWLSHVLSTFLETQKGEGTLYDGSPMVCIVCRPYSVLVS